MTIFARTLLFMLATVIVADGAAYLMFNAARSGLTTSMREDGRSPPPLPPAERSRPPSSPGFGPPPDGSNPPDGSHPPDGTHPPPSLAPRENRPLVWTWVLLLEAVALLPLSWLFAVTLAAPLKRFSQAAERVGRDPSLPALTREGPRELAEAADAFNAMQARLKRLIDERTHMVGAIAHDLRTPLMRLAFRLDDLEQPLGEKVRADIEEMRSMISAALDFIRDRSSSTQRERLDLRLLVERVVEEQSDLGHDVVLAPGLPVTVAGDPLALRRAVTNVVENAIRYGERARLNLTTGGARCRLEVDDDGPGIPESLQSQVFDPFFRIEGSRNRNTGGSGLGLAAVRAIIREHSGEVSLGNRKEGGLKVTISLPQPTTSEG